MHVLPCRVIHVFRDPSENSTTVPSFGHLKSADWPQAADVQPITAASAAKKFAFTGFPQISPGQSNPLAIVVSIVGFACQRPEPPRVLKKIVRSGPIHSFVDDEKREGTTMRKNKIKEMWRAKKCVTLGWL